MEGNGGGGGGGSDAAPRGIGMQWASATSAPYSQPLPFVPQLCEPTQQQQQRLTCLKLGKRPCCWGGGVQEAVQGAAGDAQGNVGAGADVGGRVAEGRRKEKVAAVARCQVQGCDVALSGAKEYHRRHKVCEVHSKAPRVVVHGNEQRFCQQCSRFHGIAEFDDAKRSCRRRLAGHNERRRKSNASEAMARGAAHPHGVPALGHGFPPYGLIATSPAGALSLLSSARAAPWPIPMPEISARSSAALDDLIAENRASLLAWQFFSDRSPSAPPRPPATEPAAAAWHAHPRGGHGAGWLQHEAPAGHVTLDLMQVTTAATAGAPFRPVPGRAVRPAKEGDAACTSGVWTSYEGARVV